MTPNSEPKHLNRYCTYRYQSRTESGLLGQRTLWPNGHLWCHRVHPLTDQPPAKDFSLFADRAVDRHLGMSSLPVVGVTPEGRCAYLAPKMYHPSGLGAGLTIREALGSSPTCSDHLDLFHGSPVFKSKATLCKLIADWFAFH